MYKASDTYRINFFTSNFTTGALAYADSLPTVKFMINGIDQTAAASAVVASGSWTGEYEVTATIPSSAVAGADVSVNVKATVSSIDGAQCIDHFQVVGANTDDINAGTSGFVGLNTAGWGTILTNLNDNAFGKWEINTSLNTLTLYRTDGVTAFVVFDLTPASNGEFVARVPRP